MWSIALIVGVAAAASITLLIVGVTLAITIERRRYRKYIEQHTAGALFTASPEPTASTHGFGYEHEQSQPQSRTTLRNTSKTWITLPSTENIDLDVTTDTRPQSVGETPMATRKLRKTLHGPVKKKHRDPRRTKRTKPLVKLLNSPLSAITEHSDQSFTTQNEQTEQSSSHYDDLSIKRPSIAIRTVTQSPAQISFSGMNDPNQIPMTNLSGPIRRSCSMTTTLSMAPGAPLPPLPVAQPLPESKFRPRARTLSDSIHSVSSSVLEATPVSLQKGLLLVEKTQSQALQDFDFQLNSATRWRSPVQVASQSPNLQDPRAVSSMATNTLVNSNKKLKRSVSENTELTPLSSRSRSSAVKISDSNIATSSKHGIHGHAGTLRRYSAAYSASPSHENDPFVVGPSPKLISFTNRTPLKELGNQNVLQRSPLSPSTFPEAVEKHEISLGLNPTSGSQVYQHQAGLYSSKPHKLSSSATNTEKDHEQYRDDRLSCENHPDTLQRWFHRDKAFNKDCWLPQKIVPAVDNGDISPPSTPDPNENIIWQFNIIPPDTPKAQLKQSPFKSRESPILPSPAYSSAKLRDQSRISRVRGPRSPRSSHSVRSHSQSPVKSKQIQSQGAKSNTNSATLAKKRVGPNDLRRSIQLLRGMNSEARLLSAQHAEMYNQLGDLRSNTVERQIRSEQVVRKQEQTNVMPLPSSKDFLSPQMQPTLSDLSSVDGKRSLVSSNSPSSFSRTSIWEDVSVRNESPNLDIRLPAGPQRRPSSTETIEQYRRQTPESYIEDFDEYEKFVQNYGRRQSALQDKKNKIVGLGVQVEHSTVPDTPQSMYDENGFLKG